MMKKKLYRLYFLSLVLLSTSSIAQTYNKQYDFNADFKNSTHTATVKTTNNNVVAGGTLAATGIFAGGNSTIEITVTNPSTGSVITNNNYSRPGLDLQLVDLIESDIAPNKVIVVANATDPTTGKSVLVVFKTNPLLGGMIWVRYFSYPNPASVRGAAITSSGAGDYFILSERETTNTVPGVIKIDENGFDIWKVVILTKDLVFKGADLANTGNRVIVTGNLWNGAGLENGMLIAEIDATTGGLVSRTKVESLDGDSDLFVTDIGLLAGVSSLVGNTSSSGFVLQFDAALTPTLAKYYTSNLGEDLAFTGIQQANVLNSYVSFDYSSAGDIHPGVLELNSLGLPSSSVIFNVDNYKNSSGLIDLNGNYLIKGATELNALNHAQMALTATQTPLTGKDANCSEKLTVVSTDPLVNVTEVKVKCEYDEVLTLNANGNLNYTSIAVFESDCPSPAASNSMKSADIDKIESHMNEPFTVYPNPSTGLLTLELNEDYFTEISQVNVFNPLGELIVSAKVNVSQTQIDLSDFSGLYLISIVRKDGVIVDTKRVSIH